MKEHGAELCKVPVRPKFAPRSPSKSRCAMTTELVVLLEDWTSDRVVRVLQELGRSRLQYLLSQTLLSGMDYSHR